MIGLHELVLFAAPGLVGLWVTAKAWVSWRWHRRTHASARGEQAPFLGSLVGADGRTYNQASFQSAKALVVVFMSNRCPGVKAYDERLRTLHRTFKDLGVRFAGINPIDEHLYPSESLEDMTAAVEARGIEFPYLKDRDQATARAFGALCTPHIFVLDASRRIRYQGRVDDAFVAGRVKHRYLEEVLEDLVEDREPRWTETAPLGCSIDWAAPAVLPGSVKVRPTRFPVPTPAGS